MSKNWRIAIVCICVTVLLILATGVYFFGWEKELNSKAKTAPIVSSQNISQNATQIGTQVGPGNGPIVFPLGKGVTRVEATAKIPKMPMIGEDLKAETITGEEVKGQVIWVGCSDNNRHAVATILTMKYGLVTTGLKL